MCFSTGLLTIWIDALPRNAIAMIRVETCTSIHQTDPETWDAFADEKWFHKHRFVASVEDGCLPGAEYWYLLFHNGDEVIGNCALSTFNISLDLFASKNRIYSFIKRVFPEIFKIRMSELPFTYIMFHRSLKQGVA